MLQEDVLIGGEESGGISFKGHIPEGDGPIMGLLLVEMMASCRKQLTELVDDLLADVGPVVYQRVDLRLSRPVAKAEMTDFLARTAPRQIGNQFHVVGHCPARRDAPGLRDCTDRKGVSALAME